MKRKFAVEQGVLLMFNFRLGVVSFLTWRTANELPGTSLPWHKRASGTSDNEIVVSSSTLKTEADCEGFVRLLAQMHNLDVRRVATMNDDAKNLQRVVAFEFTRL